jgi:uncharacterized membrane protein YbhN (UPF0104 family)
MVGVRSISDSAKSPGSQTQPAQERTSSYEGDAHRLRNGLIWTVALGVMFLAIGFAVPDLRSVLGRVADAHAGWLVLAVALELASCLCYVAVVRLVLPNGPAREVRRLAWAEQAFGAVVPVGGAGGLAVGAWAMRAWGISWSRIVNRSAVIFLLTSFYNGVMLALAGLAVWAGIGSHHTGLLYGLLPALFAGAVIGFFVVMPFLARRVGPEPGRIGSGIKRLASWVRDTEAAGLQPNWRALAAIGYLLFDIAALWACLRAVGASAPVFAIVLGYQIGYLANLVPVPGGIGVLEGGLLGALLLYGLPAAPTAAAVVIYHAIVLWVPTIGGTFSFVALRKTVAARSAQLDSPAPDQRPSSLAAPTSARRELAA